MKRMHLDEVQSLPWFQELLEEIQRCRAKRLAQSPCDANAFHQRLATLARQQQGWVMSLANAELPLTVRRELERLISESQKECTNLEHQLAELDNLSTAGSKALDPQKVLDKLNCLSEVLQSNCPGRGNIELSGYIDAIKCHPNGKIELRMFKLGAFDRFDPEVAQLHALFATPSTTPSVFSPTPLDKEKSTNSDQGDIIPGKPQIRKRRQFKPLNTDDLLETSARAEAMMEIDRFAAFGPEFFWTEQFQLPAKLPWHVANADAVAEYKAQEHTYDETCIRFGRSKPIILKAIRHASRQR